MNRTTNHPKLAGMAVACLALLAAACGSESATPTTTSSTAVETTLASSASDTEEQSESTNTTPPPTAETTTTSSVVEERREEDPQPEEWERSPYADAVVDVVLLRALDGGDWSIAAGEITEPRDGSDETTCGVEEPPYFDGLDIEFSSESGEVGQVIFVGDGVEAWSDAFERVVGCSVDDGGIDAVAEPMEVEGADWSLAFRADEGSEAGQVAFFAARSSIHFTALFFETDANGVLPTADQVAPLLAATLQTLDGADRGTDGGGLDAQDLTNTGFGEGIVTVGSIAFDADPALDPSLPEACEFPDFQSFAGIETEFEAADGSASMLQVVTFGGDPATWITAFEQAAGCATFGNAQRFDAWIDGADQAVLLGPDPGGDAPFVASAVGSAGDTTVIIVTTSDSVDHAFADPLLLAELAALVLARQ